MKTTGQHTLTALREAAQYLDAQYLDELARSCTKRKRDTTLWATKWGATYEPRKYARLTVVGQFEIG